MTGGVPCQKTYERILSIVNPEELENIFNGFLMIFSVNSAPEKDIINLDGRVTKGSSRNKTAYSKKIKPLNVLNAYSNKYGICLASEMINDKTNEIIAIPDLLKRFNVKGNIITWNVLNTQTKNVEIVIDLKGDYEINRGNIPLNPEISLGYYVSTISLGGKKIDVMTDYLTLEMLADKMSVYAKENRQLSEGILAEMLLWNIKKEKGLDIIEGVTHLSKSELHNLDNKQLKNYLSKIDPMIKFELFNNLLTSYNEESHKSAYIIANMENFKH